MLLLQSYKKNALPKRAVHPFYHISVKLSASLTEKVRIRSLLMTTDSPPQRSEVAVNTTLEEANSLLIASCVRRREA